MVIYKNIQSLRKEGATAEAVKAESKKLEALEAAVRDEAQWMHQTNKAGKVLAQARVDALEEQSFGGDLGLTNVKGAGTCEKKYVKVRALAQGMFTRGTEGGYVKEYCKKEEQKKAWDLLERELKANIRQRGPRCKCGNVCKKNREGKWKKLCESCEGEMRIAADLFT